ncbi:MAG: CHAT domain-containing protein [Anaerolineae bacterium]
MKQASEKQMMVQGELEEKGTDYYKALAQRVADKTLLPDQIRSTVKERPLYASLAVLEYLAQEALDISTRSPKQGWSLAAVINEAAALISAPLVKASCAFSLGVSLSRRGLYHEAMPLLQAARDTFVTRQIWLKVAHCDREIALIHRLLTRRQKALELFQRTKELYLKNNAEIEAARCEREMAIIYTLLNRFDAARESLGSARALFKREELSLDIALCDLAAGILAIEKGYNKRALDILPQAYSFFSSEGILGELATCLFHMGRAYDESERYEEALEKFERARTIFSQEDMLVWTAYCDNGAGLVYWRLGKLDQAIEYLERGLQVFEANDIRIARAYCEANLGNICFFQHDYERALELYERARQKYQSEDIPAYVARSDVNIGVVCQRKGQYSKALALYKRAQDVFSKRGPASLAALCASNMAETYTLLNQPDRALRLYEEAREIYQREGQPFHSAQCDIEMSQLYLQQHVYGKALETLLRAREICHRIGAELQEALCVRAIGDVLTAQQDYDAAQRYYRKSKEFFTCAGLPTEASLCDLALAKVHYQRHHYERAETLFRTSLEALADLLPEQAWQCEAGLAEISHERADWPQALAHYDRAIAQIQRARRHIYTEELAGSFFAVRRSVYDRALILAVQLGQLERALEIAEDSKAQTFVSLLHRQGIDLAALVARDEHTLIDHQRRELQQQIVQLRRQVLASFESEPDSPKETEVADREAMLSSLKEKVLAYEEITAQLQQSDFARIEEEAVPFSLESFVEEAKAHLPTGWSCLEYYLADDDLIIMHFNASQARAWRKKLNPMDQMTLRACASPNKDRRILIYKGELRGQACLPHVGHTHRRRLYHLLIPPEVQKELSPDKLLFIVPHQTLHFLPFHALESEEGSLVEQAIISYLPSLYSLQMLLRRSDTAKRKRERVVNEGRALLIGISSFQERKPALPRAVEEIETLQQLFGRRARCLVNSEATVSAIKEMSTNGELRQFEIIHFATHAYLDDWSGLLSGISLYDDDLFTPDICQLSLDARLVVLSACQSALGQVHQGDEMIGLSRALFSVGAERLVASLWHVEDALAKDMMVEFYRELGQRTEVAVGLNAVQRAMIRDGYAPYYWASFVALGKP